MLVDYRTKKLIEGAIDGDTAAFEQLIGPWRKIILYRCIRLTNIQDAEDVAQEALLNIFKSISTLKEPEKFEPWLHAVVNRTCAHAVKKIKKDKTQTILVNPTEYEELADNSRDKIEFLPHEYAEDREKRELLMGMIDDLKPQYREALLLFYYEQMSYREIGEIMEKSEQQVTKLLFRARASIKKKLEKAINTQLLWSAMPIGGIPVLAKAFHTDADSLVTAQMCENLTAGLHEAISSGNISPGGSYAAGSTKIVTFKIFIGIIAVSGLTAAVILSPGNREEVPAAERLPLETPAAESRAVTREDPTPPEPFPVETEIITIEDMIGEEFKERLLSFEAGGTDEGSWQAFLDNIGAEMEDESYFQDGTEYRIYILQKQDKQLVLFERKEAVSGKLDILHQFGSKTDGIPYMTDVILLFDTL